MIWSPFRLDPSSDFDFTEAPRAGRDLNFFCGQLPLGLFFDPPDEGSCSIEDNGLLRNCDLLSSAFAECDLHQQARK